MSGSTRASKPINWKKRICYFVWHNHYDPQLSIFSWARDKIVPAIQNAIKESLREE